MASRRAIAPAVRLGVLMGLTLPFLMGCEGCQPKPEVNELPPPKAPDYSAPLPEGQMALRKIDPSDYPSFKGGYNNRADLRRAIDHSLDYMSRRSSQAHFPYLDITHERGVATLRALRQLVETTTSADDFDNQVRTRFEVYKSYGGIDEDGKFTDRVLFTGYCTPIYEASRTRTGPFVWPLYRRPADLLSDPATGNVLGRAVPGSSPVPYYTRAQIEGQNLLAGTELVYLKDRFDSYIITIQGSARLQLTDGSTLEIGYAGNNGYEYTSPGRQLIADGKIKREELNLAKLREFFAANPELMDTYLWLNQRYVFFTESQGGPFGSLNVPVTTMRTIATDKAVYPRAMPAFLDVDVPFSPMPRMVRRFNGFMMDQDTGGAIRAAGRCDIFMGIGPQAEGLAGNQLADGALYYVAIKPELIAQYSQPTADETASLAAIRRARATTPTVVPASSGGSRSVISTDDAGQVGPQTDSLPVKDQRGPPPPGGWPKTP